jgi:hypothetical protein
MELRRPIQRVNPKVLDVDKHVVIAEISKSRASTVQGRRRLPAAARPDEKQPRASPAEPTRMQEAKGAAGEPLVDHCQEWCRSLVHGERRCLGGPLEGDVFAKQAPNDVRRPVRPAPNLEEVTGKAPGPRHPERGVRYRRAASRPGHDQEVGGARGEGDGKGRAHFFTHGGSRKSDGHPPPRKLETTFHDTASPVGRATEVLGKAAGQRYLV